MILFRRDISLGKSWRMPATCVANALFHMYVGVGDYTLPLDHVLVRSDIRHLGYHGNMCDYVWRTWDQQTFTCSGWALWLASEVWRGSVGVMSGALMVRSGSWAIGIEREALFCVIRLMTWIAGELIYCWSKLWNYVVQFICVIKWIMLYNSFVWLSEVIRCFA